MTAAAVCSCARPAPKSPRAALSDAGSPLGPSYVLIPLPSEDDSLLGRVLHDPLEPGRSLEEAARPNPCLDKLAEPKTTPLANKFEDAQDLALGSSAGALLGTFGFAADVQRASYFVYKLETDKRVGQSDTREYVECCSQNDCGYGYVSALIHGEGEYATGEQTRASAEGSVMAVASAEGFVNLKVLNRRKVKGWIAALVTVTDRDKAGTLGVFGLEKAAGIETDSLPTQVKSIYEHNKVEIDGAGSKYVFRVASGERLTENEFIRRYRDVTGSDELDAFERRRNTTGTIVWGTATAASLGLLAYGITHLYRNCTAADAWHDDACEVSADTAGAVSDGEPFPSYYLPDNKTVNSTGVALTALGGAATVVSGIFLTLKLTRPDGSPTKHDLSDADARIYASRYNRALLRKTVRDVKQLSAQTPTLQMVPSMGVAGQPSGLLLLGRF